MWIAAFVEGRSQSVRIGSDFSNIRSLNGGIPQGTKLGPHCTVFSYGQRPSEHMV